MHLSSYLAFVAATVVLMAIPGPNVAAVMAASIAGGSAAGIRVVMGAATAMLLQLTVVCVGLSSILTVASRGFEALRWAGAAYLAGLGMWMLYRSSRPSRSDSLRHRPSDTTAIDEERPVPAGPLMLRGFLVSLTNPKTLLFFGAFFPQFLPPGGDQAGSRQLAVAALAATFLCIAIIMDSAWALLAGRLRSLVRRESRTPDKVAGALLIGGAIALSATRSK